CDFAIFPSQAGAKTIPRAVEIISLWSVCCESRKSAAANERRPRARSLRGQARVTGICLLSYFWPIELVPGGAKKHVHRNL
ncbi:hypothetical protein, partial [Mesorhizobium sp.]|uniref:hypothetical protein n=1 Tax=Mesorhizobium sp. TaxID=1871066 RepID=UPI0026126ADD